MTRKNFPTVLIGTKKFLISQRGLFDGQPKQQDQPPMEGEISTAMRALGHCERSSHPTVPLSDVTMAIRRRYGYISPGAMIVALSRLRIDMRSLSRLEVFAAIRADWVEKQRGTDRSFNPQKPLRPAGRFDSDQYSHPGDAVVSRILDQASLETF
jgi:hypothetical protein